MSDSLLQNLLKTFYYHAVQLFPYYLAQHTHTNTHTNTNATNV